MVEALTDAPFRRARFPVELIGGERRGHLDTRRTLRKNMSFESIPFHTIWKRTRIDRPTVMALCDVSGSVAAVSRFLLMFLYSLTDVLSGIRSFAYSNHLIEVSEILARREIDGAIDEVMKTIGFGSSDYGRCLAVSPKSPCATSTARQR
jgi:uncharacterized protein with von Willebrand factor type A (vWA) domain